MKVIGATGKSGTRRFFKPLNFKIGKTLGDIPVFVFTSGTTALNWLRFVGKNRGKINK